MNRRYLAALALFALTLSLPVLARQCATSSIQLVGKTDKPSDQVVFGGTPARNLVNTIDKNVPVEFSIEDGKRKNIKWIADIGNRCYGGPIVADGIVFVGTTNSKPRDPKVKGDKAILMAFREADGAFLWQIPHNIPDGEGFGEAIKQGLCSTPAIENKKLYYVTPGCEIVCANTSGKIEWTFDMMKELKVVPYHLGNCSPIIVGDLLMICTSNGRSEDGKIPSPKAPSFLAINKNTRKVVWQSNLPGDNIIEGQWSNPVLATVNGKQQVIFAGGDCVLYSFEPATGELIWKCNCNPVPKTKEEREINPYIVATPVVANDRLYVGLGIMPEHGALLSYSHFLCIDVTKKGDVSPKNLDAKNPATKDSALVWAFGGPVEPAPKGRERRIKFGKTISTAAVQDGLVYIAEETGYLHCLDAKTGERCWDFDFKEGIWGSPYWVDGKVYIGTLAGDVFIFAAGKERKYYSGGQAKAWKEYKEVQPVANLEDKIESTPIVVNGVLYIGTNAKLFAIANGK